MGASGAGLVPSALLLHVLWPFEEAGGPLSPGRSPLLCRGARCYGVSQGLQLCRLRREQRSRRRPRRGRPALTRLQGFVEVWFWWPARSGQQRGRGLLAGVAPGLRFPRGRRMLSFDPKNVHGGRCSGVVISDRYEPREPNFRDLVLVCRVSLC